MDELRAPVRKFVFEYFLKHSQPPMLEEVMASFNVDRVRAVTILKDLDVGRDIKLLPGTSRILMAFPFSAIATPYQVTRKSGQRYFANCAWDAIAFHPMLGEDLRIDSFCHHCGQPVLFKLSEGREISPGPDSPRVYLGLPAAAWWKDIVLTCSNEMLLFHSDRHLLDWRARESDRRGESLSVDQTVQLSVPIYRGKLQLDYSRPSKEDMSAHFAKLGLTGEFWEL